MTRLKLYTTKQIEELNRPTELEAAATKLQKMEGSRDIWRCLFWLLVALEIFKWITEP